MQAVDDEIMVGWHAVPDRQNLLGAMRSGAALGRVMALLGVGREGRDALERAALEVDAEAGGMELRGLNGYRVELVNIGPDPYPAQVWRAALESCGRGARDLLDRMERVAGPHTRLVMAGGWSEGVAARAVKEAHIGPFERSHAVFMGARGAALTAGRAAGVLPAATGRPRSCTPRRRSPSRRARSPRSPRAGPQPAPDLAPQLRGHAGAREHGGGEQRQPRPGVRVRVRAASEAANSTIPAAASNAMPPARRHDSGPGSHAAPATQRDAHHGDERTTSTSPTVSGHDSSYFRGLAAPPLEADRDEQRKARRDDDADAGPSPGAQPAAAATARSRIRHTDPAAISTADTPASPPAASSPPAAAASPSGNAASTGSAAVRPRRPAPRRRSTALATTASAPAAESRDASCIVSAHVSLAPAARPAKTSSAPETASTSGPGRRAPGGWPALPRPAVPDPRPAAPRPAVPDPRPAAPWPAVPDRDRRRGRRRRRVCLRGRHRRDGLRLTDERSRGRGGDAAAVVLGQAAAAPAAPPPRRRDRARRAGAGAP